RETRPSMACAGFRQVSTLALPKGFLAAALTRCGLQHSGSGMSNSFGTVVSLVQQGLILLHFTLVITFAVRVIIQRLPVGASLAWLLVLALLPYVGVGMYLLFGERFLGVKHQQRRLRQQRRFPIPALRLGPVANRRWEELHAAGQALPPLRLQPSGIPAPGGTTVDSHPPPRETTQQVRRESRPARHTCHLEFY